MYQEPSIYRRLFDARTLSGSAIYKPKTDHENHFRAQLSTLSYSVASLLERHGVTESQLSDTVTKLRAAKNDPRHYGDNQPNSFFDDKDRTPVVADPRFTWWDLYQFGVTGPGGYAEFIGITEIIDSIDKATLLGLIGLLLIESSVEFLDHGDPIIAAAEAMEAASCLEQMMLDRSYHALAQSARVEFARKGGIARHADSDEHKRQVLAKWDTGVFKGNKTEAGNWAYKNFDVNVEVARRWIREHEKNK